MIVTLLHAKILKRFSYLLSLFIILILLFAPVKASSPTIQNPEEEILSYDSDITINGDASLTVREKITVTALNIQIKRGIYRDFPTIYPLNKILKKKYGFTVTNVLHDGIVEPYFIENIDNGMRVFIGNKDTFVSTGIHTYLLEYTTPKQVIKNQESDELYYNIIGNGWSFPINESTAKITLPGKFIEDKVQTRTYSGAFGSTTSNANISVNNSGGKSVVTIKTTNTLKSYNGLTAQITFPKGFINYPFAYDGYSRLFMDNPELLLAPVFFVLLLIYYLTAWKRHGKDPKHGVVIPRFYPPNGLSPAGVRYIDKRKFDNKVLIASLVNLGVNKFVKISEKERSGFLGFNKNTTYSVSRISEETPIPIEEKSLIETLFPVINQEVEFTGKYSAFIAGAVKTFSESLENSLKSKYFVFNYTYLFYGIGISVFYAFTVAGLQNIMPGILELVLIVAGIGIPSLAVLLYVSNSRKSHAKLLTFVAVVGITLFLFDYFYFYKFKNFSFLFLAGIICQVLLHILFFFLLPARTVEGTKLKDEIDGFRMFLSVSEENDIKAMYKEFPQTLEVFEKYLPYAIALDVELKWTRQFDSLIKQAQSIQGSQAGYVPYLWYSGDAHFMQGSTFMSSFSNSLSATVSSSVNPPSSSGGFSGGGGGGGGGW